jgi:hypothetical protein
MPICGHEALKDGTEGEAMLAKAMCCASTRMVDNKGKSW